MDSSGDYTIQQLTVQELDEIVELFRGAYGHHRDADYFHWKYRLGAHGAGIMAGVRDPGGKLVAHCGGCPARFVEVSGATTREYTGQQVADVMTARAHRRVAAGAGGLFVFCLSDLIAASFERGIPFMWGVVPDGSPILHCYERHANGHTLLQLDYWKRELSPRWLRRWRNRDSGYRVHMSPAIDALDWDEFFERVASAYGLLAKRTRDYVDWRHRSRPGDPAHLFAVTRQGRLCGWSAFRQIDDRLRWGDALFDPDEPKAAAVLIEHALRHPSLRRCRVLEGWFPHRPDWWLQQLHDLGMKPAPEPQSLCAIYACDVDAAELPAADSFRERLYYTLADTDLF